MDSVSHVKTLLSHLWQRLKEEAAHGGFFLQRMKTNVIVFDAQGHRLDLPDVGASQVNEATDRWVWLGDKMRLPARLIMVRVSEEVAQACIARMKQERHEHGTVATPGQIALTHWTMVQHLFLTLVFLFLFSCFSFSLSKKAPQFLT